MTSSDETPQPAADSTLRGKVALVVGGTQNMGALISGNLARLGADVVATFGHDHAAADRTVAEVESAGGRLRAIRADATDAAAVGELFDGVRQTHGAVDVVVHLPGMVRKGPLADATDDDYTALFDANTRSAFLTLRAAARTIADGGRIIVLSTTLTSVTTGLYGLYAGSKAAVEQFVKAASQELGPRGVTVNAVAPGPVDTRFFHSAETPESVDYFTHANPRQRLGAPTDVAPVVAFLATDQAGWITGQTIRVNGGMF